MSNEMSPNSRYMGYASLYLNLSSTNFIYP